jgi:hypothetical protein
MLFVLVIPASAQLGDKDESKFYVQNVSGNDNVSVTVKFVDTSGGETTPSDLGDGTSNPFTLAKDEMKVIDVTKVAGLPTGQYSVDGNDLSNEPGQQSYRCGYHAQVFQCGENGHVFQERPCTHGFLDCGDEE